MEPAEKEKTNDNIDNVTIKYEEDGLVLVKELKKVVLSKGAWATLMFLYQELDRASGAYKPAKVSLRRYQKKEGNYIQRSKFNISSEKQAYLIAQKIHEWYPGGQTTDPAGDADSEE